MTISDRADGPAAEATPSAPAMRLLLSKLPFLLSRAVQVTTALNGPLAAGRTLPQTEIMLVLGEAASGSQRRLARAIGMDTSTTAHVIDNLDAAGWVERVADPDDRRRSRVRLTARGVQSLPTIRDGFARLQHDLLAPFTPDEADRLIPILGRIAIAPGLRAPPWTPDAAPLLAGAAATLLRRALQGCEGELIASMRPVVLTPRQFSLLHLLAQGDSLTQRGFARLFGLDPATCAVIMRNLAARQLLESRTAPDDRRKRYYRINDAGHDVLAAAQPLADAAERRMLDPVDPADRAWLNAALRRLIAAHAHRLRYPGQLEALPRKHP